METTSAWVRWVDRRPEQQRQSANHHHVGAAQRVGAFPTDAAASGFLTGFALNHPAVRNDFAGFVGMILGVGPNPLTVSAVGRVCLAGNSQTHTVKFVATATGSDVPGASAQVNTSGCTAGAFVFASLGSPLTLNPLTIYYLVSQRKAGGDQWYDAGQVTSTADAGVVGPAYPNGSSYVAVSNANTSYVPPDFQYTVAASTGTQPLTTGVNLNNRQARNDFSGFVGMRFMVGPNSITIGQLGRYVLPGNTRTHTVKLVDASTGLDVAGGSVAVNTATGTPGSFVYANLPSSIVLKAGGAYYLVSQETANGDSWPDYNTIAAAGAVQVTNAVYSYSGGWQTVGGGNTSYVPQSLTFQ